MQQVIQSLENLSDELGYILAQLPQGEQFNPRYFKDPENFKKMIRADVKIERVLVKYFRSLGKRLENKVDWFDYQSRAFKGSLVQPESKWKGEVLTLEVLITDSLEGAFEAGGLSAETQVGFNIGFTAKQPAAQAALRKNSLNLAKSLTKTTRNRLSQSLLTSIQQGHTQAQAASRMNRVLNDPRRANMIAHTETVRAYSQGRLEVGRQVGAKFKVWRNAQPGAEENCISLDGVKIPLKDTFSAGLFGSDAPPLHPNCFCILELEL